MKIKQKSSRLFVNEGRQFQRGFNQAPLRCLGDNEVTRALKEIYQEYVASTKGL